MNIGSKVTLHTHGRVDRAGVVGREVVFRKEKEGDRYFAFGSKAYWITEEDAQ